MSKLNASLSQPTKSTNKKPSGPITHAKNGHKTFTAQESGALTSCIIREERDRLNFNNNKLTLQEARNPIKGYIPGSVNDGGYLVQIPSKETTPQQNNSMTYADKSYLRDIVVDESQEIERLYHRREELKKKLRQSELGMSTSKNIRTNALFNKEKGLVLNDGVARPSRNMLVLADFGFTSSTTDECMVPIHKNYSKR